MWKNIILIVKNTSCTFNFNIFQLDNKAFLDWRITKMLMNHKNVDESQEC
jgi:hypothetical protein